MKKEEEERWTLPEVYPRRQLNALYREIPLKDTTSRMLRKYFNAMANLYGVISLRKAYEIISSQNPGLVTEKEFLAFAAIARHEDSGYVILGEDEIYIDGKKKSPFEQEIIDTLLAYDDFDPYSETKKIQQGKPFYIPDKKQLLLYEHDTYCEETPAVKALLAFMVTRLDLTEEQALDVLPNIMFSSRYITDGINSVMKIFNHMQVTFKNDADMQRFAALYTEFHNTNRLQCNRGHTPDELTQMVPREQRMLKSISLGPNIRQMIASGEMDAEDLRRQFMQMDLPDERIRFNLLKELADAEAAKPAAKPVGRNDPCPCGSGKKYKKCCGR